MARPFSPSFVLSFIHLRELATSDRPCGFSNDCAEHTTEHHNLPLIHSTHGLRCTIPLSNAVGDDPVTRSDQEQLLLRFLNIYASDPYHFEKRFGIILGSVVGGCVVLSALIFIVFYYLPNEIRLYRWKNALERGETKNLEFGWWGWGRGTFLNFPKGHCRAGLVAEFKSGSLKLSSRKETAGEEKEKMEGAGRRKWWALWRPGPERDLAARLAEVEKGLEEALEKNKDLEEKLERMEKMKK